MQTIINNSTHTFLGSVINKHIKGADEVVISTAFLKRTGVNLIADALASTKARCTFYIGTDYYLTEPDAIRKLMDQKHKVYRVKKAGCTFHPKTFYFRKKEHVTYIAGSSNVTGGGLATNIESSVVIEFLRSSKEEKACRNTWEYYAKFTAPVDDIWINQYQVEYDLYRQKCKIADKEFKKELRAKHSFDFSRLPALLKEYKEGGGDERFAERTENYAFARKQLDRMTRKKYHSQSAFLVDYEQIANSFSSSGLLRGKSILKKHYKRIISAVAVVKRSVNKKPEIVFQEVMPFVKSANRFGVNAITEIMNTYNPQKFSVANGRTIKSLGDLKLGSFSEANNFSAAQYKKYNELIVAIAVRCRFHSLRQVDHFLSWYYQKYY